MLTSSLAGAQQVSPQKHTNEKRVLTNLATQDIDFHLIPRGPVPGFKSYIPDSLKCGAQFYKTDPADTGLKIYDCATATWIGVADLKFNGSTAFNNYLVARNDDGKLTLLNANYSANDNKLSFNLKTNFGDAVTMLLNSGTVAGRVGYDATGKLIRDTVDCGKLASTNFWFGYNNFLDLGARTLSLSPYGGTLISGDVGAGNFIASASNLGPFLGLTTKRNGVPTFRSGEAAGGGAFVIEKYQNGSWVNVFKSDSGRVNSFNGRTGDITPLIGDYSSFYSKLNGDNTFYGKQSFYGGTYGVRLGDVEGGNAFIETFVSSGQCCGANLSGFDFNAEGTNLNLRYQPGVTGANRFAAYKGGALLGTLAYQSDITSAGTGYVNTTTNQFGIAGNKQWLNNQQFSGGASFDGGNTYSFGSPGVAANLFKNGVVVLNQTENDARYQSLGNYLSTSGGTMTGDIILPSATPTNALSAAPKAYIDNLITGITWKNAVRVKTTANITLSGTQTIDGVALAVGNRVLVNNQTDQTKNGIYIVATGAWVRATDVDSSDEISTSTVAVTAGTANKNTQWTYIGNVAPVVGTDAIVFGQISGAGTYTNGPYLNLTGNVFDANLTAFDARYMKLTGDNLNITGTQRFYGSVQTYGNLNQYNYDGGNSLNIVGLNGTSQYSIINMDNGVGNGLGIFHGNYASNSGGIILRDSVLKTTAGSRFLTTQDFNYTPANPTNYYDKATSDAAYAKKTGGNTYSGSNIFTDGINTGASSYSTFLGKAQFDGTIYIKNLLQVDYPAAIRVTSPYSAGQDYYITHNDDSNGSTLPTLNIGTNGARVSIEGNNIKDINGTYFAKTTDITTTGDGRYLKLSGGTLTAATTGSAFAVNQTSTGVIASFQSAGTEVSRIQSNGFYYGTGFNSLGGSQNGIFTVGTSTAPNNIARSISDNITTLIVNNNSSTATGNIFDAQANGVRKFSVDINGKGTFSSDVIGSNLYGGRIGIGITSNVGALLQISPGTFTTSGNFGTPGMGISQGNITYTSTTSSGTVATAYINAFATATLNSSTATTVTKGYGNFFTGPVGNANVTLGQSIAVGMSGDFEVNGSGYIVGRLSLGKLTVPGAVLDIDPTNFNTSNNFGTTGFGIRTGVNTYNTTAAATTSGSPVSIGAVHAFNIPTMAATNTQYVTNGATVYISGAPLAGANMNLSAAWSMFINAGNTYFGGGIYSAPPAYSTGGILHIGRNATTGRFETMPDMIAFNATTIGLSSATLNSTYPTAPLGFQVICGNITMGGAIYTKYSSSVWLISSAPVQM